MSIILTYSFLTNNILLFSILCVSFPSSIIVFYIIDNGFPKVILKRKKTIIVKQKKKTLDDMINEFLLSFSIIKKINRIFSDGYYKDIEPSGQSKSIVDTGIKNIKLLLVCTIFSICMTFVMIWLTSSYLMMVILVIPVMVFVMNRFELKSSITKRKNGVERELLFFAVFCDIMDHTQSNIYNVFDVIIKDTSNLFPYMRKEGLILQRDIKGFGDSSFTALKNMSNTHPSAMFSEFINGYLTSQSMGGTKTGSYLSEKIREYQTMLKLKMNSYIELSEQLAQFVCFGLLIYPLMVVISSIFTSGQTMLMMIIFGFILIPLVIFIIVKKIESISAFSYDIIEFKKIPILLSVIVVFLCIIIQLEYWETMSFGLIVWSFTNYFMIRKDIITGNQTDKSIPRFIRDMNQTMLSGSSFFKSFGIIQKEKSYTREFNSILDEIRKYVILGDKLNNVMLNIQSKSWLTKLTIRILSFTGKSGEVTPEILEKVAGFSNTYLEAKNEVMSKTTTSVFLSYFGSLLVLALVLYVPTMDATSEFQIIEGISDIELDESLKGLNIMLMVMASFLSMLMVSKIRYSTVKHSLNNGIVLTILVMVLYFEKFGGFEFISNLM